ncbi:MAG: hypothetical protein CMH54_00420 [Myxococcales bacterium]|nr:hypothetical protein [Myxococcales bacterium]|tara:strand:+ start:2054 stop:2608 length:555 start_codon:yes stop_codon:yes gene_type:complete
MTNQNTLPKTYEKPQLSIQVNGAPPRRAQAPDFSEIEQTLRGIALADSPVLIEGADDQTRENVAQLLHLYGRRAELPMHLCNSVEDAMELLNTGAFISSNDEPPSGTWVLRDVTQWSLESLEALNRAIQQLHVTRVRGQFLHKTLPRIVVLDPPPEDGNEMLAALRRNLSFFHICLNDDVEVSP